MKPFAFFNRLSVQIALTVALVALLVFGATGWVLLQRERENLTRELTLRILAETRALAVAASSALLRQDPELELHPLVTRVTRDVEEIEELAIIDSEGICQGHLDLSRIGSRLPPLSFERGVVLRSDDARAVVVGRSLLVERRIDHMGQQIGSLRATVDRSSIDTTVAASVRRLAWTGGVGTLIGIVLVLWLVTYRLRPLNQLREGVQEIGRGELDTRLDVRDRSELGLLAHHVNAMAEGLARAQEERIRQERIDRELEIAHQIQETLLPRKLPAVAGLEIAAHYSAALEVSGDYYDVFEGASGKTVLVTADVSGKGVPGMVVMAMTKIVLRQAAAIEDSPARILRTANAILQGITPRHMFVTVLVATVDPDTGHVVYASAGHCPPVHFQRGQAQDLPARGRPLGIFDAALFDDGVRDEHFTLEPGHSILLYTDGLTECQNMAGELLGEDRVHALLAAKGSESADAAMSALLDAFNTHRGEQAPSDDLTLVVLRRAAPSGVYVT